MIADILKQLKNLKDINAELLQDNELSRALDDLIEYCKVNRLCKYCKWYHLTCACNTFGDHTCHHRQFVFFPELGYCDWVVTCPAEPDKEFVERSDYIKEKCIDLIPYCHSPKYQRPEIGRYVIEIYHNVNREMDCFESKEKELKC